MRQIPNLFTSHWSPTHPLSKMLNRYFGGYQYLQRFKQNHPWLGDTQITHLRISFAATSVSILTGRTVKLPERHKSEGKSHAASLTDYTNYRWQFPGSKSIASLKKKLKLKKTLKLTSSWQKQELTPEVKSSCLSTGVHGFIIPIVCKSNGVQINNIYLMLSDQF